MHSDQVTAEPGIVIRFPDQPDIDPVSPKVYVVRSKYVYARPDGTPITIPRGFRTDDLSAPRALWWAFPPDGIYRAGAVVHDYLYFNRGKTHNRIFTRAEADDILREIMKAKQVNWLRRNAAWLAVRLFGGSHWGPS